MRVRAARTLNHLLRHIIFQPFGDQKSTPSGINSNRGSLRSITRIFAVNRSSPAGDPQHTARPATTSSRGHMLNLRLLVLCALVLLPLLAACTGNIGSDDTGWNPPAVSGDMVYIGTKDGEVKAIVDSGGGGLRESWTFPSAGANQNDIGGVYNTPLVVGDLVYVSAADGFLYALNKNTGSLLDGGWRSSQGLTAEISPLIAGPSYDPTNEIILAPSEDGSVYAYNAKSGDEAWKPFVTGGSIWSTVAVDNGIGYFGSHDRKIYAITLNDGKKLWQYVTGGVVAGKPLVFDGKVIAGSFDKKLYALSAVDGSVVWTFEADKWFWAGAVTDGRTIFAPNMDGNIYALDKNGALLWKQNIGESIVSPPVLVPAGLVVAAEDGRLILLDTAPQNLGLQRELFNTKLGDADIKAPLVVQGDSVYVGSQDRTVRRVRIEGGQRVVWCLHTRNGSCDNR